MTETKESRPTRCRPVLAASLRGSAICAALTILSIVCFRFLTIGSGESGVWVLFVIGRMIVGLPSYSLAGIDIGMEPMDSKLSDDIITIFINALIGGAASGFAVAAWKSFTRKKEET